MDDQPVLDLYNEIVRTFSKRLTRSRFGLVCVSNLEECHRPGHEAKKVVADLPNVVYSTKPHKPMADQPTGVLVYMRTAEGNDSLAWIDRTGQSVTQSQIAILKAAECMPETPTLLRQEQHHQLVEAGVRHLVQEEKSVGGQLGRPSGARFRVYERLKAYAMHVQGTLFATQELGKAIDEVYRYPLQQSAADTLNRQLRTGIADQQLAELVLALRSEDRLCRIEEEVETQEPQIICSLGLSAN